MLAFPVLIGCVLVGFMLGAGALTSHAAEESTALETMLQSRALRGARVGVEVLDLETGEVLASHSADRELVPASNQKLLLAMAALRHWGPTHRFKTSVYTEQPPDANGVVSGPLWIRGSGDPSLVSEQLWQLAEQIRLRGIREVKGGLAIDATYFDDMHTNSDWGPLSARAYHARVSAFAANYSSFMIQINGAQKLGAPAQVQLSPSADYFQVRAKIPSLARRSEIRLDLSPLADGSGELVRLRGAVRGGGSTRSYWRSVSLPEKYAASVLRLQLQAHGVRVAPGVRLGSLPESAIELVEFEGHAVGEIVRLLNKYSNNFIAEQLLKGLGAEHSGQPGSWKNGAEALRATLEDLEILDRGTVIADGSGLSPRNRISPQALVRVIRAAATDFDSGPEFLASLPQGGLDGTLEDRIKDGSKVRAKTGHLKHVAALSGVVRAHSGRRLAFSVLVNGGRGGRVAIDNAIDAFVAEIAGTPPLASAPSAESELAIAAP